MRRIQKTDRREVRMDFCNEGWVRDTGVVSGFQLLRVPEGVLRLLTLLQ